jgi:polynucleotide 5'-hydroxyl-kinase GRC3/NOL9
MPADAAQLDRPADWSAAVHRILTGDVRRVLVLGARDAGKSSFCRVLLHQAAETGHDVALLDADPAQKLVGPPACVTLGQGVPLTCTALALVGSFDPLRGWDRLVAGAGRLTEEAAGAALLVANTSGLLARAGRRLKAAKIAAMRPDLLVALGEDPSLDAILADHPGIPALRLGRSPLARRKGEGERRSLRRAAFDAYFAGTPVRTLDLYGLWREGAAAGDALPGPGQVVALADMAWRDQVIGLVLGGAPDGGALLLRAPPTPRPVVGLRWGPLRLEGDPGAAALQPASPDRAERRG